MSLDLKDLLNDWMGRFKVAHSVQLQAQERHIEEVPFSGKGKTHNTENEFIFQKCYISMSMTYIYI